MSLDKDAKEDPKKSNDHSSLKLAETGPEKPEKKEAPKVQDRPEPAEAEKDNRQEKPEPEKVENNSNDKYESTYTDEKKHADAEPVFDNIEPVLPVKNSNSKKLIYILLAVTLIVCGYLMWLKYFRGPSEIIKPVPTANTQAPSQPVMDEPVLNLKEKEEVPPASPTPKAVVDANEKAEEVPATTTSFINSIEYVDRFEVPRLNIDLSKKVFYQIYESPGEITIVFPETNANSNLIELNNQFIKLVNVNYFKNQTTINIVLQDDIKMGNIGYAEGASNLQLTFQNILTKRNLDVSQIKSAQKEPVNIEQSQQRSYYKALDVANTGNYPKAIKQLKPLTEGDDPYIPAIESLAILYLKSLRMNDAEALLHKTVKAYPTNIKLKEYYARLMIIRKEFPQALSFLMTASPPLSQYPDYYGLIAFLNLEEQKPKVAQLYYMQLTEFNPDNVKWLLGLAVSLKMQGANNAAEAIYERIMSNGNVPPKIKLYVSQQMGNFL